MGPLVTYFMKVFFTDHFVLPLPDGHRFPMEKYASLRRRVAESGLFSPEQMVTPAPATDEQLCLAHTPEYVRRVAQGELTERELRRIGFPWSPGMVERSRRSVGATIEACRAALDDGLAVNLAGGTHHAYAGHGEGYCVFNDAAVAARLMQAEGRCRWVVIVDCDVHQGNGTAAIFAGDPSVFTFSIHGQKNFPFHKEASDLDIGLPDGTGDEAYLEALSTGLAEALERSGGGQSGGGLAIYLAGADPFAGDSLGRLSLTKEGLAERDRIVMAGCRSAGLPVAVTMSGGYAKNIADIVDIHFETIRTALALSTPQQDPAMLRR